MQRSEVNDLNLYNVSWQEGTGPKQRMLFDLSALPVRYFEAGGQSYRLRWQEDFLDHSRGIVEIDRRNNSFEERLKLHGPWRPVYQIHVEIDFTGDIVGLSEAGVLAYAYDSCDSSRFTISTYRPTGNTPFATTLVSSNGFKRTLGHEYAAFDMPIASNGMPHTSHVSWQHLLQRVMGEGQLRKLSTSALPSESIIYQAA